MKKRMQFAILLVVLLMITTSCKSKIDEKKPFGRYQGVDLDEWYRLSEALPHTLRQVNPIGTAVTDGPVGTQLAEVLSLSLSHYPYFGETAAELGDLPEQFFIVTGFYVGRGTAVGMPGATERVFAEVNGILGFPGRFVTATQHEAVLGEIFGELPHYEHGDMQVGTRAEQNATYDRNFSVYLYPTETLLPYEPILLDWAETADGYTCLVVFVQPADGEENSFYTADGRQVARWAIYDNVTSPENMGTYVYYEVRLEKREGFPPVVSGIEKFE